MHRAQAMVESRPPCPGDEIGKHSGLKQLSARLETVGAEPFKFGEPPGCESRPLSERRNRAEATPSQALRVKSTHASWKV
jgi:hypothetical protein